MATYDYSDTGSIGGSFPDLGPALRAAAQRVVGVLGGSKAYASPTPTAPVARTGYEPAQGYQSPGDADQSAASDQLTAANPPRPVQVRDLNDYGDTGAGFGFRNRLQQTGIPGEQLSMQYGPGVGGANVTATADRNGRFNQFSGGSPAAGMPSLQQQYAAAVNRAAAFRAQPASLLARRSAVQAQREADALQAQIAQQQQIGYQGRQVALAEQSAAPDIAYKNTVNAALAQPGGLDRVRAAAAARQGQADFLTAPGIYGTTVAPVSALSRNAATFFPAFPTGGNQPIAPIRPLLSPLPNELQP